MTAEEKAIERDYVRGKYKPVPKGRWSKYRDAAANTHRKQARISLRLQQTDLDGIKKIAEQKGLPYQTLINSVLHRFARGTLIDVHDVERIRNLLAKA